MEIMDSPPGGELRVCHVFQSSLGLSWAFPWCEEYEKLNFFSSDTQWVSCRYPSSIMEKKRSKRRAGVWKNINAQPP